jgi:hypothetical protein
LPKESIHESPDQLPVPATASNKKVLEEYIKNHFRAGAFNTCKRQHWPITAVPPMKIHTPPDDPCTYCRRPTKVPLHFREEVKADLEADVKKGVLERVPVGEAEVRDGGRDVRFEEVHNTEDVHHKVDIRQDDEAADVRDGEDVTEAQEHVDGSTRPKRSPKPNPKYSLDDYDLNYIHGQQVKD